MCDEYERNTEEVMAYLAQKARSQWTMRRYRECYSLLAAHLRERDLDYSDEAAWEWLGSIAGELDRTKRDIYAGALSKLGDVYATGEIKSFHYRAPKKEDRLFGRHRQVVDGYCKHLRESGRAEATVANHREAAARFLLGLQGRGVDFVADMSYADLICLIAECDEMTYCAKTGYRGKIRSLLAYLHSEGLVRYGFTLLVDAMSLKKGRCWNEVDPDTVEALRRAQDDGAGTLVAEEYLALVEELADEHGKLGYSRGSVCSVRHYGNLLYLFMDVNGLRYDPQVGRAWLGSMEQVLSRGEFSKEAYAKTHPDAIVARFEKLSKANRPIHLSEITITAPASAKYKKATRKVTVRVSLAAPDLKLTNLKGQMVKVTWTKSNMASGYQIYVKTPGEKSLRKRLTKDEYKAKILHRTISGSGCPYCSGNSVLPEDSIAHKYPDLMAEWDAVSNYAICNPNEIGENSNYDVWWNCLNDPNHKYPMPVYQRVSFYNRTKIACPYCKGRRRKKSHFI